MEDLRCYDTFLKLVIREENMETTINNFIFIFHPNKQISLPYILENHYTILRNSKKVAFTALLLALKRFFFVRKLRY